MSDQKLSVLLRTVDQRGDHSAEVTIAAEINPYESVVILAERLLKHPWEWLEVRILKPIDVAPPKPAAKDDVPF